MSTPSTTALGANPAVAPKAPAETPEQEAARKVAEKKKAEAELQALKDKALVNLEGIKNKCKEYVGKKKFNPFLLSTKVDALGKTIANRGNLLPESEVKEAIVAALALEFSEKDIAVHYEEPTQKQINPAENKLILPPKE